MQKGKRVKLYKEVSLFLAGPGCFPPPPPTFLLVFLLANVHSIGAFPQTLSRGIGSCGMAHYQMELHSGFVCCDPEVPAGICEQTAPAGVPSSSLCPAWLQAAAADLVIILLKRISRWPQ